MDPQNVFAYNNLKSGGASYLVVERNNNIKKSEFSHFQGNGSRQIIDQFVVC